MSNEEVKVTPEKSKWFNGKYRVTPGTSRLLQEFILADGGEWAWVPYWQAKEIRNLNFGYILVSPEGGMSYVPDQGEVVTRTIKVSEQMLTLSNEAADWLKGLMQNPLNGCLPEEEDERSRTIREAIFHSLKWIHETDEPISDEGMSWIG